MNCLLLALPALISIPGGPVGLLPGELEGVWLRMTLDQALAVIRARHEGSEPKVEQMGRTAQVTERDLPVAGEKASTVVYDFVDDRGTLRLARILATFEARAYTGISLAFAKRYGTPVKRVEPFYDRGVTGVNSASCSWRVQDGQIRLIQRKASRDKGRLDLVSDSLWPRFQQGQPRQVSGK